MLTNKKQKVFFALLPVTLTQAAIVHRINDIKNTLPYSSVSWVKKENLHLTLCFIGQADKSTISCLIKEAEKINILPFEFNLESTGQFEKARALWLGLNNPNNDLQTLHNKISAIATICKVSTEANPFVPHITIARKFKEKHKPVFFKSIVWNVNKFYLMESISSPAGVQYKVLHSF